MGELARMHPVTTHNYRVFNAAVATHVEKLQQPDPRVAAEAFRARARAVGGVIKSLGIAGLLILLGLAVVLWQHERKEAAAVDGETFPSANVAELDRRGGSRANQGGEDEPVKTIVDYTIFQTVEVAEGVNVTTGWNYASSRSKAPENQYCYVKIRTDKGEDRSVYISMAGPGQAREEMPKLAFAQKLPDLSYESTLRKCRWFSGKSDSM